MFAGAAAGRVDVTSPAESFTIWDEAAEPEMPMDQRRQFLIELVMSLHGVGGTTHRTEHLISAVAEKLGVLADVIAFPNFALVSFLSPDGDPTKSELHHLPITGGLDLDKLGRIDAVCQDLLTDKLDPMRAWTAAAAIAHAAPCFPPWVQFLSYPVCGFSCALTFFGGGMLEAGIATLCAVLVGLLVLLGTRVPTLNRVMEFVCAFSVGFLTRVLTGADTNDACYLIIALSALVWFLPGLSITQAVMEISSRSMISGVARLVYAFSIALQLGFGMALGSELAWWASPLITTTCVPVNRLWHILTFFGVAGSFNVLLNANLRQWPGMTFASAVGLLISEFGASLDPNLITMLCALTVGLLGTALARYLNQNALTIILSGILMLVPGSVGLRGVTALLQQNTVSGVQFGFSMLLIALSIAIGLLVARLASNTPPLRPRLRGPSASPDARMSLVRLKDLPPI